MRNLLLFLALCCLLQSCGHPDRDPTPPQTTEYRFFNHEFISEEACFDWLLANNLYHNEMLVDQCLDRSYVGETI